MGLIKVTTPENANQLEIDENSKMSREKIVKNENSVKYGWFATLCVSTNKCSTGN